MTSLTPEEYNLILQQDFMSFIERVFYELNPQTKFLMNGYLQVIASKLANCLNGKTKRLIINVPPRHLKSICASVAFPAFLLGHKPSAGIVCVSYSQPLADKMARDCRNIMNADFYKAVFPGTRLSSEKQSTEEFVTTQKGYRLSTSIEGTLTGRGGDFVIIDDPLKPDEALSEVRRVKVIEWYGGTLMSRLDNPNDSCIIIVMQRLHENDLVGHVLEQEGWEVVSFPVIAEQDEEYVVDTSFGPYRYLRSAGGILHPERISQKTLEEIRHTRGSYHFASQYQQNPVPKDGNMVRTAWFKIVPPGEMPASFERTVQSWDTANKIGQLNDYSVCTTWGIKNKHYYLINVFRRKLEFPDLKRAIKEQQALYGADVVLIEDKASGTSLIQDLIADGMSCIHRYEPPQCEKGMRFYTHTATIEAGFVHLPAEAAWCEDYVRELTSFPGGKHDDQVDSTSQFLDWIKKPQVGDTALEVMRILVERQKKRIN